MPHAQDVDRVAGVTIDGDLIRVNDHHARALNPSRRGRDTARELAVRAARPTGLPLLDRRAPRGPALIHDAWHRDVSESRTGSDARIHENRPTPK